MSWFGVDFYPICPFYLRFSTDNDGWMSPTDWLFSPLRWWQYDMITYQLAMLSRFFTTFLLIWPCLLWPCFKSIWHIKTGVSVSVLWPERLAGCIRLRWQKYKSILCMTYFVHDNSTKIKISKVTVPKDNSTQDRCYTMPSPETCFHYEKFLAKLQDKSSQDTFSDTLLATVKHS